MIFSRNPREDYWETFEEEVDFFWLSNRGDGRVLSNMNQVLEVIEFCPRKMVFLLDRFDYLVLKAGYEGTLEFMNSLEEIAYLQNHIIILSMDPEVIDEKIKTFLARETLEIEPVYSGTLSGKLLRTLGYIHQCNLDGKKPTYSTIGKELLISRPAVRKRLGFLISGGYIREEERGSRKLVEITEKGRLQFQK